MTRPPVTKDVGFRRQLRDERGQTLIEYSLVVLMVLTVMFGLIEVCRLMLAYNTLAEAAQAGVRYAATHGATRFGGGNDGPSGPGCDTNPPSGSSVAPNVVSVVTGIANSAGLSSGAISVSVCYTPGNAIGNSVTVIANYAYTPIVPFLGLASTINLTSTTEGAIGF